MAQLQILRVQAKKFQAHNHQQTTLLMTSKVDPSQGKVWASENNGVGKNQPQIRPISKTFQ